MSNVNFTVKTRKPSGGIDMITNIHACNRVEVCHDINDNLSVTAIGIDGGSAEKYFKLSSSKEFDTSVCEIIIENMNGKTTEHYKLKHSK